MNGLLGIGTAAALLAAAVAAAPAGAADAPVMIAAGSPGASLHEEGQRALDARDYAKAIDVYRRLVEQGGADVDAALYWKAFAELKARRPSDAESTLDQFFDDHKNSRWAADARALKVDVKIALGKEPADAARDDDEELKLYALDGLMQMEPERALPVLKKFLAGKHPQRLKERALFVASQSDLPAAHELVLAAARDRSNPGLQRHAIQMLGAAGEPAMMKALLEIYRSGAPPEVKRTVLEAWVAADAKAEVLAAARGEKDPDLRRHAAHMLGAMDALPELKKLLESEKDPRVRRGILEGFMAAGDEQTLLQAARTDPDADVRRHAIHMLGALDDSAAGGRHLEQLHAALKEAQDKRAVAEALAARGDAAALVRLFRAEKDPDRRRHIIGLLASLDSPEAEQLMMEILDR